MLRRYRKHWSLCFMAVVFVTFVLNKTFLSEINRTTLLDDIFLSASKMRLYSKFHSLGSFINITASSVHSGTLLYGHRRQKTGYLTIGIPSVKRPYGTKYLMTTLDSVINHISADERAETTLVVFMADLDVKWNLATADIVYNAYKGFCDEGFMHIIHAPINIYPDLTRASRTLRDSAPRVKWRSKQNLDFAFLMLYSKYLSTYYLQLEDDVITAPEFIEDIEEFVDQRDKNWICLSFSDLGFIGKMFHSNDLEKIAFSLLTFYDFMPCDMLLQHVIALLGQREPICKHPGLFQHIGKWSSLSKKMMPLVDKKFKHFGKNPLHMSSIPKGNNPKCNIQTNMRAAPGFTPEGAYHNTSSYFMAESLDKGSYYRIVCQNETRISRVVVTTGDVKNRSYILKSGNFNTCRQFHDGQYADKALCKFVDGEVDTKVMGLTIPNGTNCFSITMKNAQEKLIIGRIEVFSMKVKIR